MLNWFYKLVGFFAKVVASIVILIALVGGGIIYIENNKNSSTTHKAPEVKFSNFEEFKNSQYKVLSKKEKIDLRNKFQENFLKQFNLISKNISIYSAATKQMDADKEALEQGLFMIVSKYDYPVRSLFLKQLVKETNNLVNYSEIAAINKNKTSIKWVEFLDWFTADFDYQFKNNKGSEEYVTIKTTYFEQALVGGVILLLVMISLIIILVLKLNPSTSVMEEQEEAVKTDNDEKTEDMVIEKVASIEEEEVIPDKEEVIPEVEEEIQSELVAEEEIVTEDTNPSEEVQKDNTKT